MLSLRVLVLGGVLAAISSAQSRAAELSVDGQISVLKQNGSTLRVVVRGNAGQEVLLLSDFDPGPSLVGGQSIPLGLSPYAGVTELGVIGAGGEIAAAFIVPIPRPLDLAAIHLVAAISDPASPSGFELTNAASFVISNHPFAALELAGDPLTVFPHFEHPRAFHQGAPLRIGVDPTRLPFIAGKAGMAHVVAKKTVAQWKADASLVDVTPDGAQSISFAGPASPLHVLEIDSGSLSGAAGDGIGVPYDVVIDLDGDAMLGPGDLIDGYGEDAGLFVVHDVTQGGPHAVTEALYSGGTFLGQNLFYPSDVANLGALPLVVVSHGNGHNYQWYDHIGNHLASYGFIVMSHQNQTGPGVETASTTTLTNTDWFLGNLATIENGTLLGHVDSHRMTWIGHSRGGEGVVRAYDRIHDGTYVPLHYVLADIRLVSSIAPTDFLGTDVSTPHSVPYSLWVGGADADVTGCAGQDLVQSFHLHDRAEANRQSISLHGVGHGDFHNSTGSVAMGPCLVGKPATHAIMRGYLLALVQRHVLGNVPAKDFLTRQWERFHPIGAPAGNPCVVVDLMYRDGLDSGKLVLDDFQDASDPAIASSGAIASVTAAEYLEGRLDDGNANFTQVPGDPWNGVTQARTTDAGRGAIFEWSDADVSIGYQLLPAQRDVSDFAYLSLRAAQQTRHPLTQASLGDLTFDVELIDGLGNRASIGIGAFGGGIEEPYQRAGCGAGAGWAAEFETIRIPLDGFRAAGSQVDLTNVDRIGFEFGPTHGSAKGRIALDDIELTVD